jgi:signal transduction histidine kinase
MGGQQIVMLRHVVRRQPFADITVALVLFVGTVATTAAASAVTAAGPNLLAVGAAAVACGALTIRRQHSLLALLVSLAAAESYLAIFGGGQGSLVIAAPLLALYTFVESTRRRRSMWVGLLAVLVLAGAHVVIRPAAWMRADNLALLALGGLAVAAGDAARSRREYLAEVEDRVRRAEEMREAEARRRVTDERLRIARDLHDVVGHQLALISVQAGVASQVLPDRPDDAQRALAHVRQASRTALEDLGDTISLLRDADQPSPTDPAPGLASLPELIDTFERSGLRVAGDIRGRVRDLPAAVDLAAYRIVQESLTNVVKHAQARVVRLVVDYRPAVLYLQVDNELSAVSAGRTGAAGHGLIGMRERVNALGGSFAAGLRPGPGYRVTAALPLNAGDAA